MRYGFAAGEALLREEMKSSSAIQLSSSSYKQYTPRVCSISYYYLFVSVYALLARYNSS